jgi:two-component system response regulator HydG
MARPPDDTATALAPRRNVRESAQFRVTVVDGPDRQACLVIDRSSPSRVYVGTSPTCDLRLTDRRVSRRHLALELADEGLRVSDLDSTNGTYVEGVRIFAVLLAGSQVVRLGETTLRVEQERAVAAPSSSEATSFGSTIGASPEMRRVYLLCEKLALSGVPVLIEGETGTGKEVLAESLHARGPRAQGPFVVFDCTGVPPTLVESELFGHERGAFTGSVATRRGVFEQAHEGTLLIDEIGDLDIALQPKLLRALERGEVRRVGGDRWLKVDVRVLAATRRNLDKEVQDGRFRDDLFFRLVVARIELPPLRAREGDVALLASHFWREAGGAGEVPYELLRRFERHDWPGNVRELANAVTRYLAIGDQDLTAPPTAGASGDVIRDELERGTPFRLARDRVLAEFERRYLEHMLARHGGNVTKAAQASGIGRRYFTMIATRQRRGTGR